MSNMSSTISPRRRERQADAPAAPETVAVAVPEIEAPRRILIRLPAIAPAAASTKAKSAAATNPTHADAPASKAGTSDRSGQQSIAAANGDTPWYGRLYTPRVQKYLPYATVLAVALVGLIMIIRNHSHRAKPVAADADTHWNSGGAVPNRQAGSPSPAGSATVPEWNGPSFPASQGATPSGGPSAAGGSPSAYSQPNGANPSLPPAQWPTPSSPTSNYASNSATAGAPASPTDYVPPMPARSPAWGNPPASEPAMAQSATNSATRYAEALRARTAEPSNKPPRLFERL